MKKIHLLYYILFASILCACEADPQWNNKTLSQTVTFNVGWRTIDVQLNVDNESNSLLQAVEIEYSLTDNFTEEKVATMKRNTDDLWEVQLADLRDSSTYYIHINYTPSYLHPSKDTIFSLQTKPKPAPSIVTKEATSVTATTAILNATAQLGESNDEITERGFYYSLLRTGEYGRQQVKCGGGEGDYNVEIVALRANATYYFVAYAINKHGIAFGDTLQFNTINPY